MSVTIRLDQPRFRVYGRKHIGALPQLEDLSRDQIIALQAASAVLPFRVNSYVLEELIDWGDIPDDPIYQLTFPQAGMLDPRDFERMQDLVLSGATDDELKRAAHAIQMRMNPHPAGQMELNVPSIDGKPLSGCSTSTARPCCSSRRRARPATPTAPTASAGPSSSARRSSASPRTRSTCSRGTSGSTPRSRMSCSPAAIR